MSDSKTRVAAIGAIQPGGKLTIIASAAQFNHGKEGVVMLPEYDVAFISGEMYEEKIQEILGKRTAEVGLNPDNLSPTAAAAHAVTTEIRNDDIRSFAALLKRIDSGKGAHTLGYSTAGEQSDERRQVIIDQVRMAKNQEELNAALESAYWYDPSVYQCMKSQYGDKFGGNS